MQILRQLLLFVMHKFQEFHKKFWHKHILIFFQMSIPPLAYEATFQSDYFFGIFSYFWAASFSEQSFLLSRYCFRIAAFWKRNFYWGVSPWENWIASCLRKLSYFFERRTYGEQGWLQKSYFFKVGATTQHQVFQNSYFFRGATFWKQLPHRYKKVCQEKCVKILDSKKVSRLVTFCWVCFTKIVTFANFFSGKLKENQNLNFNSQSLFQITETNNRTSKLRVKLVSYLYNILIFSFNTSYYLLSLIWFLHLHHFHLIVFSSIVIAV